MTTYQAVIQFQTPRPFKPEEIRTVKDNIESFLVYDALYSRDNYQKEVAVIDFEDVSPPAPLEMTSSQFRQIMRRNLIDYKDEGDSIAPYIGEMKVVVTDAKR